MPAEDRPDDETIDNDAELDAYLTDLSRKHAQERMKRR